MTLILIALILAAVAIARFFLTYEKGRRAGYMDAQIDSRWHRRTHRTEEAG